MYNVLAGSTQQTLSKPKWPSESEQRMRAVAGWPHRLPSTQQAAWMGSSRGAFTCLRQAVHICVHKNTTYNSDGGSTGLPCHPLRLIKSIRWRYE